MSLLLGLCRIVDRANAFVGQAVSWLLLAAIFVSAGKSTTGVVAASVISMGLISLPIMLRYGYDRRIASGTIAASLTGCFHSSGR